MQQVFPATGYEGYYPEASPEAYEVDPFSPDDGHGPQFTDSSPPPSQTLQIAPSHVIICPWRNERSCPCALSRATTFLLMSAPTLPLLAPSRATTSLLTSAPSYLNKDQSRDIIFRWSSVLNCQGNDPDLDTTVIHTTRPTRKDREQETSLANFSTTMLLIYTSSRRYTIRLLLSNEDCRPTNLIQALPSPDQKARRST